MLGELMRFKSGLAAAFLCLVALATPAQQTPAEPSVACSGSSITVTYDTPPVCNCTGGSASVEICHSETVTIDVGGSPLTVSTGQSSSQCVSRTVPHGTCLFWRYKFTCCESFWGWSCTLKEAQARSSTSDCT